MSLNSTPSAERTHIAFFGRRNAGKSSLINAFASQEVSIVSDTPGTTTDPVRKAMELLPLGPVLLIDTAGIDDEGELGEKRIERAKRILNETDIAILVIDSTKGISKEDTELSDLFKDKSIPFVTVYNKIDLCDIKPQISDVDSEEGNNTLAVSSYTKEGINDLKEHVARLLKDSEKKVIISDLVSPKDMVVLVIPIDESAPKGRIILPQQMVIRELLENDNVPVICKPSELALVLEELKSPPAIVITDSQAFKEVDEIVPASIRLTSFSILLARFKGTLMQSVEGTKKLDSITDDDIILISEGCTHHRQCEDIGTVKLPAWIKKYTNANPKFEFSSGKDFAEDIEKYSLVIHCGACMLNEREVDYRYGIARSKNIPMTNYGMIIAKTNGILDRSMKFDQMLNF